MQYNFLIIDDSTAFADELLFLLKKFPSFTSLGVAVTKEEAIHTILEYNPQLVFLHLGNKPKSTVDLNLINELHIYLNELPCFIVFSDTEKMAFEALKAGVFDYQLKPPDITELRKAIYKFYKVAAAKQVQNQQGIQNCTLSAEAPQAVVNTTAEQRDDVDIQVCIKSYGDYQFIALKDVVYLKADNNTTDFYLQNGKSITAYKTLKHYENNLPSFFYRIHNSYIVNSNYVMRINTGKSLCYLSEIDISVPFSKTFKESIDAIIRKIAPEYL